MPERKVVGRSERRVDGMKLATGRGTFAADIALPGLLHGRVLGSPYPHARIRAIDATRARAIPGVVAVLTHEDVPRKPPAATPSGARDRPIFDSRVRFVGDRVAVVAAEDPELARRACEAVQVDYEVLPHVLDAVSALEDGAPGVHDEVEGNPTNLAQRLESVWGDIEAGFAAAERVFEATYSVPAFHPLSIEAHMALTWLDEDNRLTVRSSTEASFDVRGLMASLLGIPLRRIHVVTPRIGGGFGSRQEIFNEDLCGLLTLRTGRPVRLETTRGEELAAATRRAEQTLRVKSGIRDGRFTAIEVSILTNAGAFASPSLAEAGMECLTLYRSPNLRYEARIVYTNTPPASAFRGYGSPQAFFALESHVDEVALATGDDPIEIRRRNHVQEGDTLPFHKGLEKNRARFGSCGLDRALDAGAKEVAWGSVRPTESGVLRGVGVALAVGAPSVPGVDAGAASLKMSEDGSFNLFVGIADGGTGSDTILSQIAAETLGVSLEAIVPLPPDTDLTPMPAGTHATPGVDVAGGAVEKAARMLLARLTEVASRRLSTDPSELIVDNGALRAPDGRSLTFAEACSAALAGEDPLPMLATATHAPEGAAAAFAAAFAEVEVDPETGVVRVLRLVEAVDIGQLLNPGIAEGRIEGAALQAVGLALTGPPAGEAEPFPTLRDYVIPSAVDAPEIVSILVPTEEVSGPFGSKPLGGVPLNAPAAAIANAVARAAGIRIRDLPLTPERVLRALAAKE